MNREHERQSFINQGEIQQDAVDNNSNAHGIIINNSNDGGVGVGVCVGAVAAAGGGGIGDAGGSSGGSGVFSFRSKEIFNQEKGEEEVGAVSIRALMHDMIESIAGSGIHFGGGEHGVGGGQGSDGGPSGGSGGGHDEGGAMGGSWGGAGAGGGGGGADGGSGGGGRGVGGGGEAILTGGMPMENLGSHAVGMVTPGPSANGAGGHEVSFGRPPRANESVRFGC